MVLLDSLRFDYASSLPTFYELAKSGRIFERMYAPSTFTNAVINSLQSGMYPPRHGYRTWDPGGDALPDTVFARENVKTLDDYFREAGYTMITSMSASMKNPPIKIRQHMIPNLFECAITHQPFCLFLHCWEVHDTCITNQSLRRGLTEDLYRYGLVGAEGFLQTAISENVANTLWVIFGDHGLGLMDDKEKCGRGSFGAGQVYDFRVRVPCAIFGPGIEVDCVKAPCSLVDIMPTLLDYANITVDSSPDLLSVQGRSILQEQKEERFIYTEAHSPNSRWPSFHPNVFGATDGRIKVMVTPEGNLCYDLIEDPREDYPCEDLMKTQRAKDLLAFIEEIREDAAAS